MIGSNSESPNSVYDRVVGSKRRALDFLDSFLSGFGRVPLTRDWIDEMRICPDVYVPAGSMNLTFFFVIVNGEVERF